MDSNEDADDLARKNNKINLPRPTRVKNKAPAPVQITAEQILREAHEQQEPEFRRPKQNIADTTELADLRFQKRKDYEDRVRRARQNVSEWIKYATWEEEQKDMKRARSVWERALEVDYKYPPLWLKYAEMEMKNIKGNKELNHARNVLDRAVQYLPRVNQLWYKYVNMEEKSGNVAIARQIFERWMTWMPEQEGWLSYIKFELRYNEVERARAIFERFVQCHPGVEAWIQYAKFEVKNGGDVVRARKVYERAVEKLADDEEAEKLFVAFAEFEEQCKVIDGARRVYKLALDHIPKGRGNDLYKKSVCFEKRYGDREGIENAIVGERRIQYEDEVRKYPLDYDSWFDYIRLEENAGNKERVRQVYGRAVANVPPANEKRYWHRYIYLWINYALYEELDTGDADRAREVYTECLNLIPHKKFSFAKIWILAAMFEIRQLNLTRARQILGTAIGKAPKDKIFKKYIEIELQLAETDRCRKLYNKYLIWNMQSCYTWIKYAEFEKCLGETDRARALFELAINQVQLDKPELVWDAYIDFELLEFEFDRARQLFERLLERTKHLEVWKRYAKFEADALAKDDDDDDDLLEEKKQCIKRARRVFERALDYFITSAPDNKEDRSVLLEEWLKMEASFGDLGDVSLVQPKLPKKLKRRQSETTYLKILEAAYRWKKKTRFTSDEDWED